MSQHPYSRRTFIKTGTYAGAAVVASSRVQGQGAGKKLKVGLIGCGGRGRGATGNFIEAAGHVGVNVEVVAVADAFQDRVDRALKQFEIDPGRGYVGFDAYRKVTESDADVVISAAPPCFRPVHLEACVEAGKHCFIEKPVAVDPPGARKVIALGEEARKKELTIVAGTQRRYGKRYLEAKSKLDNGAIGEILGGALYWNMGTLWKFLQKDMSPAEYLARNWLNFTEMSGDHIVEQHVHQLDVAYWFMGRPPVAFIGSGGRARRDSGNQFDFFSVDMDWGNNVRIHSMCRQVAGCYDRVGEMFRGAHGTFESAKVDGKDVSFERVGDDHQDPFIQEHVELIKSVTGRRDYLNCAEDVAVATMIAIGGRISAYTGKLVRWVDLMEREESEWFNLACSPAAPDFEKGEVALPAEVAPIPGEEQGFKPLNA